MSCRSSERFAFLQQIKCSFECQMGRNLQSTSHRCIRANFWQNSHCQPWRNCLSSHSHRQENGDQNGGGVFRSRRQILICQNGGRSSADWSPTRPRILLSHGKDFRCSQTNWCGSCSSRIWISIRKHHFCSRA